MKVLVLVFVLCVSACMPKPAFVDSSSAPASTCGPAFACTETGGRGSMLLPFAALLAVTAAFAVAIYGFEPERRVPHAAHH
jgi:hypothetical protein